MVRSARPGSESCRFCGSERVAYRYPCPGAKDWLTCLECAIAVDAEDMEALALRAVAVVRGRRPRLTGAEPGQALRGIRASHARFMESKGERQPV